MVCPPDGAHTGREREGRPQSGHHLHSRPCGLGKVAGPSFHGDRVGVGSGVRGQDCFLASPSSPCRCYPSPQTSSEETCPRTCAPGPAFSRSHHPLPLLAPHRGPTPGEIQGSVYVSASFSPPISPLPPSSSSFTAPVGMLSVSSQQQTENSRGHHLSTPPGLHHLTTPPGLHHPTTPPGLHQTLLSRLPAPRSSVSPVASSLSSFFLHASSSAFLPGSTQQLEESF